MWRTVDVDEQGFYEYATSNTAGKWDYWLVGGLWDGLLTGSPSRVRHHQGNPRLSGRYIDSASYDAQTWLSGNMIAVGALPQVTDWSDEIVPYAIVTPDGNWYEVEDAGGSKLRDAIWMAQVQDLLNDHLDCIAVVLDCHS
jgi:hypothetical protein